jgi:hypothetical protein
MERRYQSTIISVGNLPPEIVQAMAALYLSNYDGSSNGLFLSDLRDKDEAMLLLCDGELVGFTTLKVYLREWNGVAIRLVYSGDTIVHPQHWGQQELAFAWITHIGEIKRQAPETPLYWFLLVKGHRTFKYLPVFGHSFYPHWAIDRSDLKPLADQLATEKFGDAYNPQTGVVEFAQSHGHLKDEIAGATEAELKRPATQFFFQRNPGYRRGHELVCICELELHNLKPLTARIFQHAPDALVIPGAAQNFS